MALTLVTVTKKEVSEVMSGQWSVTCMLKGFDGAEEIFSEDFNQDYKTGDLISRVENGFVEEMQDFIDEWNGEQTLFEHAQMDTAITNIQTALEV